MLLSLATIIGLTMILNDLLGSMGANVDWDDFMNSIQSADIKDIFYTFALMMHGMFIIMGTPIIVFLTSIIGLSITND
jgi:hypothetical protein